MSDLNSTDVTISPETPVAVETPETLSVTPEATPEVVAVVMDPQPPAPVNAADFPPPVETPVTNAPEATVREALGITGATRVGAISMNPWNGQVTFQLEEGQLTAAGFVPTRLVTEIGVMGETYTRFLAVKGGEDGAMMSLVEFLENELKETLSKPATAPQSR